MAIQESIGTRRSRTVEPDQEFFRLTVVEITSQRDKKGNVLVRVICKCGVERLVTRSALLQKRAKSCGCFLREWQKSGISRTHGHTNLGGKGISPEFGIWMSMIQRCRDKNSKVYKRY
jgi:hypothetical protein